MTQHYRTAGFIGYEEVRVYETGDYHRYDLHLDSEDIDFDSHEGLYIPPAINKADFILLLIYDFSLTACDNVRPSKVIYTDFYFKALQEEIREFQT